MLSVNQIYPYSCSSTQHKSKKMMIPRTNATSDLFNVDSFINIDNNNNDDDDSHSGGKKSSAHNGSAMRSQDLHKLVIKNNMSVRRSNTLNNPNYMVKRSNTYHQNHVNIPISRQYSPIRNHTINLSSQKRYSKINTYENFERLQINGRTLNNSTFNKNNPYNTRIKELSPLQIQRNKMKSSFIFPNGEKFTPKEIHSTVKSIPTQSTNSTATTTTTITTNNNNNNNSIPLQKSNTQSSETKSTSKKFGTFWKKLVGKDTNKVKEIPSIKITEPASSVCIRQCTTSEKPDILPLTGEVINSNNNNKDMDNINSPHFLSLTTVSSADKDQDDFDSSTLVQRLEKSWDIVNVNSSISILNDSIIASYISKENRNVSFATEIFVNDTYSSEEYHRADPDTPTKKDRKLVFDNEFGFIDEVKYELNQYKRKEMLIHIDSIQFVQFSR